MPAPTLSSPPDHPFYENAANAELWRIFAYEYQKHLGPDSRRWSEREEEFVIILNDAHARLRGTVRRAQL